MHATRIDTVSKLFAKRRISRRQALATGGAGIAAAGLAAAGMPSATAQETTAVATPEPIAGE